MKTNEKNSLIFFIEISKNFKLIAIQILLQGFINPILLLSVAGG
jgi:hypothetical protein